MNWADVATPYQQIPSRHRPELSRPETMDDDHDSDGSAIHEPKLEETMGDDSNDDDTGENSRSPHYPDTHLGRLASIFSERMPCTGMYGPSTSMAHDGPFAMHPMDPGGEASADVAMVALDCPGPTTASGSNYALPSSMDMQPFDEQTSVDLRQLFPTTASHEMSAHTTSQSVPTGKSCYAVYPSHPITSLPSDHGLGPPIDQFAEPYPSLPSQPPNQPNAAHMMVPFPFDGAHASAFDEPDDLAPMPDVSTNAMEMQEVSNLFNNASLMTPPTAINIPRTTIVSPMNGFGPPRMMLPPTLRDFAKTESLANAFDDEDNIKFSPDRRKLCVVDDCKSQARAFNRCKRHGGSKRCSQAGCTKSVQSRGLCIRHGGGSRCQENGCTRAAQSHGKCKMHGGGRPCVVPGCEKKAHLKRLCRKHGGGAKCSLAECDKWAQRQGMCMTHSKHQHALLASPPLSPSSSSAASPSALAAESSSSPETTRSMRTFFAHDSAI